MDARQERLFELARRLQETPQIGSKVRVFGTEVQTWMQVITMVQLALRHPDIRERAATDSFIEVAEAAELFVRGLVEALDPAHGDLWEFLQLGFEPVDDEEAEAERVH